MTDSPSSAALKMYCPLVRETTSAFSGITTEASEHCCGFWQYCRTKGWKPVGARVVPSALSSLACALSCGAWRVWRANSAREGPCDPDSPDAFSRAGVVPDAAGSATAGVVLAGFSEIEAGCTTMSSFSWIDG